MPNNKTNVNGLRFRSGSWHLRRMVKGHLYNTAIGRVDVLTKEEAEQIAVEILNGKSLIAAKSPNTTLAWILNDLLASPRGLSFKDSYRDKLRTTLNRNLAEFKDRPLTEINKHHVLNWYRKGANKPTGTDNTFRILNTLFEYAIAHELIDFNPCALVSKTGRYRKKTRSEHLSSEDGDVGVFAWALATYEPPQAKKSFTTSRDATVLLFVTGLRTREVTKLQWLELDFEHKRFVIKDTKNRRDHMVPMTRLTYALFLTRYKNRFTLNKALKGEAALEYVFPNRLGSGPVRDVRKTLNGVRKEAGLSHICNHDFRRTFSTICETLGIEESIYAKMMNHHTGVTGKYVQTSQKTLLDNFELVSRHISLSMPVYINEKPQGAGAGEPENLLNLLYGDAHDVDFSPTPHNLSEHYQGLT